MNRLEGIIESIKVCDKLSLVNIKMRSTMFSVLVIDTPSTATYLKERDSVQLIFKETAIIIAKDKFQRVSLENKIAGRIKSIVLGELLSKLTLETDEGNVVSIITTNSAQELQLQKGDEVLAMVKTNEVMLKE